MFDFIDVIIQYCKTCDQIFFLQIIASNNFTVNVLIGRLCMSIVHCPVLILNDKFSFQNNNEFRDRLPILFLEMEQSSY